MGCFKHFVFGTQSLGYCLVYDSIVGKKSVLNIFLHFVLHRSNVIKRGDM